MRFRPPHPPAPENRPAFLLSLRPEHGVAALPALALAGVLWTAAEPPAAAGEWTGGGLPPAIAKPRPSADVPADLPGSGAVVGWPPPLVPVVILPRRPEAAPLPAPAGPAPATRPPAAPPVIAPPPAVPTDEAAPIDLLTPRPVERDG